MPTTAGAKAAVKGLRGGGLTQAMQVSPALKKFFGVGEISRADSMKRLWVYIKDQNLQNPENKKEIICDEKLKTVLGGKDKVGFLEIAKLLGDHFPKTKKAPASSSSSS